MRLRSLDVLRAVAILLVLGRHSTMSFYWYRVGWTGVDLFFVLSGFLVSGLLFTEFRSRGEVDVSRFLVRRGFKIYPGFYVLFAAGLIYQGFKQRLTPLRALAEAVFVQNYFPGLWEHTWSLAVEEHFYGGLALTIWLLVRWHRGNARHPFALIPYLCAVGGVMCLGLRMLTSIASPYWYFTHAVRTHLRIDSLLFGVAISYFYHSHHEQFFIFVRKRASALLILVLVSTAFATALVFPQEHWFMHTIGFTVLYIGFGALLVWCLSRESLFAALPKPFRSGLGAIGQNSYSIYLWHLVLAGGLPYAIRYLKVELWTPRPVEGIAYVCLSIAVGICMAKIVEFPMLRVRDRLFPSLAAHRHRIERVPPLVKQEINV